MSELVAYRSVPYDRIVARYPGKQDRVVLPNGFNVQKPSLDNAARKVRQTDQKRDAVDVAEPNHATEGVGVGLRQPSVSVFVSIFLRASVYLIVCAFSFLSAGISIGTSYFWLTPALLVCSVLFLMLGLVRLYISFKYYDHLASE